jgi:glycerol uptake facilitator-like aquaporin
MLRRLFAELLASAFLLAAIVGSGIMAEQMAGGNAALALLGNTLSTGAMLAVLIVVFGPVSGAHMNPAVTVALALHGRLAWSAVGPYVASQVTGALIGTIAAHAMFGAPLIEFSTTLRGGPDQWLAEVIATFGLVLTILGCVAHNPQATPWAVGLYIAAAYWFTSSTSFANPAVSIARAFSDTFAGIAPAHVPAFILAQGAGTLAAVAASRALWRSPAQPGPTSRSASFEISRNTVDRAQPPM